MRISGLNLRDFEYVIAVAELGSFVKAAERCHITQPALSIQIGKLEERLNTMIFERSSRRSIVTPRGDKLIEQMRKIVAEARILLSLANINVIPFTGTLKIAAISTLGPYYFPHAIAELRRSFPDLTLMLNEGKTEELQIAVLNGTIDAALIATPVSELRLESLPLFFEPFMLASSSVGTHNLESQHVWDSLNHHDRLVLSKGHCLRSQALTACSDSATSNRYVTSLETLKCMVAAGEGLTLVPALAATEMSGVTYTPVHDEKYGRTVSLVWRSSDPRAAEILKIAQHLKDSPPCGVMSVSSGVA